MYLYMYTIYVFIIHTVQITVKVYVYRWICMYIMLCILHIYSLTWIVITDKYVYIQLSLMAQWWRICLPLQEMRVWSLGRCGKIPWRRAWQPTPVILAWRIPWTEEPGGLHSMGSQRVGHNWSDRAQTYPSIYLYTYIYVCNCIYVHTQTHRHTHTQL